MRMMWCRLSKIDAVQAGRRSDGNGPDRTRVSEFTSVTFSQRSLTNRRGRRLQFIMRIAMLTTIVIMSTAALHADPDPRFFAMWHAAQRLKPSMIMSSARIAPENEPGTPLVVEGLVLDATGRGIPGVEVFAYHTDSIGLYTRPGDSDPWRLKGWALTDANGRFTFQTIRPAPYPSRQVPAHIHVTVTTTCCGRQFTDLMFDDDSLATQVFREHFAAVGEHGLYGTVRRDARGTQLVSYTIHVREHGDF
jgi:Dioxygenase